jgi:hypothetical protein
MQKQAVGRVDGNMDAGGVILGSGNLTFRINEAKLAYHHLVPSYRTFGNVPW